MHKEHRERNRGQCTRNIERETEFSAQRTCIEKQRSVHKEHRERNRGQGTRNIERETEVSAQRT